MPGKEDNMRRYNFTFYNIDPETDEVLDYTERIVWAANQASAQETASEWAYKHGYNDFEEDN